MPFSKKYRLTSYFLLLTSCFFFLPSCHKDKPAPPVIDLGYGYFPLKVGSYIIYDVVSIVHNDFTQTVDTIKYQLQEKVESTYKDNEGRTLYRLERYKRNTDTSAWVISDVWASYMNASRAEKFEENIWYMKLIFPVKANAKWNGNSFNSMDEMEYEYTEVNVPKTINNLSFDSTLTVLQADELNAINKFYSEEKYAKNIGLIYKQYIKLDLQKKSGLELTLKIKSFVN